MPPGSTERAPSVVEEEALSRAALFPFAEHSLRSASVCTHHLHTGRSYLGFWTSSPSVHSLPSSVRRDELVWWDWTGESKKPQMSRLFLLPIISLFILSKIANIYAGHFLSCKLEITTSTLLVLQDYSKIRMRWWGWKSFVNFKMLGTCNLLSSLSLLSRN